MTWIFLLVAIIGNATANILMKMAAQQMGGLSLSVSGIKTFLTTPLIWAGLICFGITLMLYTYVLSKINLNIAYPLMTSLGFLIVATFSVFYLQESLSWLQIMGMILVVGGLSMIVYFAK